VAREVIAQLESVQEGRALSGEEVQLCKHLKKRLLGLVAIERSRARQKSRLTWMKLGDTNTKYFQAIASARKKKIFIESLLAGSQMAINQLDKHNFVFNHYKNHIGAGSQ
jgi:hypothetical protein